MLVPLPHFFPDSCHVCWALLHYLHLFTISTIISSLQTCQRRLNSDRSLFGSHLRSNFTVSKIYPRCIKMYQAQSHSKKSAPIPLMNFAKFHLSGSGGGPGFSGSKPLGYRIFRLGNTKNVWNEWYVVVKEQASNIQHTKSELPQLALLFWLCDLSINLLVMASISKQAQIPLPYDVTFQSAVNSCPKYEPLALGLVCVEKTSARNGPSVQNLPLQCSQGTLLQPLVLVVPQAPAEILCRHLLRYG